MITSPFNADYVKQGEFNDFKGFVGEGFDTMENLIVDTKIEINSTLTDTFDKRFLGMENRLDKVEIRLGKVESKIDDMNVTLNKVATKIL